MASRHQKAVLSYRCHGIAVRPPVDGDILTDARAGPRGHGGWRNPVKLEILRVAAHNGEGMNDHPVSKDRPAPHDCIRVNLAVGPESGPFFDDCCGMDGGRHQKVLKKQEKWTPTLRPESGARAKPGIRSCQTAGAFAGRVASARGRWERSPVGRSSCVSSSGERPLG